MFGTTPTHAAAPTYLAEIRAAFSRSGRTRQVADGNSVAKDLWRRTTGLCHTDTDDLRAIKAGRPVTMVSPDQGTVVWGHWSSPTPSRSYGAHLIRRSPGATDFAERRSGASGREVGVEPPAGQTPSGGAGAPMSVGRQHECAI